MQVWNAATAVTSLNANKGISFEEIEVINNHDGKPELILHGTASEIAGQLGVEKLFISLSDEKKYAIAYVILESK